MAERRVSLPISNKRVEDILMWRDVQKSGIIFGSLTAGYLVLEWSGYSMLSLLAYAMLGILGGFLVWTNAAALLKKPGPPIPSFVKDGVSDDDILKVAQKLTPAINDALGVVHRTITGADMVLAAKVCGALFVIAKIGGCFSLFTLCYIGVLAAFALPKVYELKKDEIDGAAAKALEQAKTLYSKAEAMAKQIPKARATDKKTE
ncbi:unnamed protein product [Ostreobium quekettii]|uniref:Reticulon-like protein n=1 Tax=Ostreobium quekettii TaxID=121088 RepID=A0A8S1J593_9CHLO|nr:unnamed protein product [Ostreobium quekettii]